MTTSLQPSQPPHAIGTAATIASTGSTMKIADGDLLGSRLLVAAQGSEGFVDRVDGVVRSDLRGHHSGGRGHEYKSLS